MIVADHPSLRSSISKNRPTAELALRRWPLAKANLNYRASENGKQKGRAQAARYRGRCKERQAHCGTQHQSSHQEPTAQPDAAQSASPPEGYHKSQAHEKSCCHRPGCYQRFTPAPRSPLQRFCCPSCRKALRAVLIRERRWSSKLISGLLRTRDGPL